MHVTDRAHITTVTSAAKTVGVQLPKPVVAAFERRERLIAALAKVQAPRDIIVTAVAAALDEGRDVGADPAVQAALATVAVVNNEAVIRGVDALGSDACREACTEHADAIVGAYREPFTRAGAVLVDAHRRLGGIALDDHAAVVQLGNDAAAVWASATAASNAVATLDRAVLALGELTRQAPRDPRYPVLRVAAVDHATWQQLELDHRKLTPWEVVGAGLELALPTLTEYRERIQTIQAGDRDAALRHEAAVKAHLSGKRPVGVQ